MPCPRCAATVADGLARCSACGASLVGAAPAPAAARRRTPPLAYVAVAISAIIIGWMVAPAPPAHPAATPADPTPAPAAPASAPSTPTGAGSAVGEPAATGHGEQIDLNAIPGQ